MKWNLKKIKVSDLKEWAKNPRRLTDNGLKHLERSIKKFGIAEPIVINTDNTICGGHGRKKVLEWLNIDEVDCYMPERKLTDKEFEELNIRLNKNIAGEWDYVVLKDDFNIDDLLEWGFDEDEFDFDVIPEETQGDDDIPVGAPPITVLGDLYELGNHRLLCGDSTIIDDVEKLMDGNKADMVFTDPPYGVNYTSRVDKNKRKQWGEMKNDTLQNENLWQFLNDSLGSLECNRYICCNWQSYCDFTIALGRPNSLIVWDKESIGLGAGHRNQHEFILFYGKLDHNSESNVWRQKRESTKNYEHPTQKPVEIPERAIINLKGKLCYDAFLGSGSTLIACEKTTRKCYGMELDQKYCDVIVKRYIDFCEKNKREYSVKRNGIDCLNEFK